jgi:hypothetical protein
MAKFFAQRVTVYFVQLLENYRSTPLFRASLFHAAHAHVLTKNGLGYILGDFLLTHLVARARSKDVFSWKKTVIGF